jgi:hypothetical protein
MGTDLQMNDLVSCRGMTLTPTHELALPEADYVLGVLCKTCDVSKFYIGDLLNYCESTMGEMYAQLVDDSKYSPSSLQQYKWVAKHVIPENRRDLSFAHHVCVAKYPTKEQAMWIDRALEEGWSSRRLAKELPEDPRKKKEVKVFHLTCPACNATMDISADEFK